MPAVTRDVLREAIIFRADLPDAEPRRVSDAQLNTLINRSMLRLQGILQRFDSEDYQRTHVTQVKTAGVDLELPGTFSKVIHVMWQNPTGQPSRLDYVRLQNARQEDIERRGATPARWAYGDPPKWYVTTDGTGNSRVLRFTPEPTEDESLLLVVQYQLAFSDDTTPVVLEYAWEEWIVLDCMMAIRQRDKQDASDIYADREKAEQMIRETAPERFKDADIQIREEYQGWPDGRYLLRVP